jgi:hypothetical protein
LNEAVSNDNCPISRSAKCIYSNADGCNDVFSIQIRIGYNEYMYAHEYTWMLAVCEIIYITGGEDPYMNIVPVMRILSIFWNGRDNDGNDLRVFSIILLM